MRDKNIKRAAHALYLSQGDDKNSELGKRINDPEAKRLVKDQGRAIVCIEKLLLPYGKDDYSEEEMYERITTRLKKKGHRIQGDEEEDTPEYLEEKRKYEEARKARVTSIWGHENPVPEKEKESEVPEVVGGAEENSQVAPDSDSDDLNRGFGLGFVSASLIGIVLWDILKFKR